jgi:hypothetical protein
MQENAHHFDGRKSLALLQWPKLHVHDHRRVIRHAFGLAVQQRARGANGRTPPLALARRDRRAAAPAVAPRFCRTRRLVAFLDAGAPINPAYHLWLKILTPQISQASGDQENNQHWNMKIQSAHLR